MNKRVIYSVLALFMIVLIVSGCTGKAASKTSLANTKQSDYSMSLPPGYPQCVLPIVPGAQIKETTHSSGGPYLVTATVPDLNQTATFYDKELKRKGKRSKQGYNNIGKKPGWTYGVSIQEKKNITLNIVLEQILDATETANKANIPKRDG